MTFEHEVLVPQRAEQLRNLKNAERLLRDVLASALQCDSCYQPVTAPGCMLWTRGDGHQDMMHLIAAPQPVVTGRPL